MTVKYLPQSQILWVLQSKHEIQYIYTKNILDLFTENTMPH